MATKTAENVAAVQIFATLALVPVMNDFYFQYDHQPSHTDLVDLVAAVADVVTEVFVPILPATWKGNSVFAYDMTVPDGANAVDGSIAGVVGSLGGTASPNQVTLAIARKNGLRGRAGNGRIFWMGLSESALATTNEVAALYVADMVAACKAIDVAAADVGGIGSILSFQRDGVVHTAATVYPIAEWIATDSRVDTQRGRLPKA